jgi:hypothetical protein
MPGIPLCLAILSVWTAFGQTEKGDWDAYVMRQQGGKPVSTVVDLSLAEKAPMKDKGYAILVRTALINPDADGMPSRQESDVLHRIEDLMEKSMAGACDAVYAGRFTHRGIREFVFFSADTSTYRKALESVFTASPGHSWRARTMADTGWSNYFDVLYPPPVELERIRNRRLVDILSEKGDALKTPRRVDHFLRFRTKTSREAFLRALSREGFSIGSIPEADKDPTFPYALQLFRNEVPEYSFVDRTVIALWERALQGNGRYEGWETHLVKSP